MKAENEVICDRSVSFSVLKDSRSSLSFRLILIIYSPFEHKKLTLYVNYILKRNCIQVKILFLPYVLNFSVKVVIKNRAELIATSEGPVGELK